MSQTRFIEECAALWVLRREEPGWSSSQQAQLDEWLAESDAHKVAFWRLEHGWREADRIASLGAVGHVVTRQFYQRPWAAPLALAASLLLVFAFFFCLPTFTGAPRATSLQFETPVGGHRIVSLPDGSRIELNTDTAIKATIDQQSRSVWLERGEAFFDVAKLHGRKFVIYAGARTVTVLGTKFSIRRDPRQIVVAVLEGRVSVDSPTAGADRHATVETGDVAIATNKTTFITNSAEAVQQQLAWRSGRLTLHNVTLAAAVEQFNRYNQKQLVIADPDLADMVVRGSFLARDVDAFAALLRTSYGLTVTDEAGTMSLSGRHLADRGPLNQLRPSLLPSRPKAVEADEPCGSSGAACAIAPLGPATTRVEPVKPAAEQAASQVGNWQVLRALYPPRALAAREEGTVGFTVKIDGTGNPTSCRITQTSGHPLLDLETCELIMVHTTFKRVDGVSRSQLRSYEGVVNWRLPAAAQLAAPVPPKPVTVASVPEEMICKKIPKPDSNAVFERKCMTKSEWQRVYDETRATLEQLRGDRAH